MPAPTTRTSTLSMGDQVTRGRPGPTLPARRSPARSTAARPAGAWPESLTGAAPGVRMSSWNDGSRSLPDHQHAPRRGPRAASRRDRPRDPRALGRARSAPRGARARGPPEARAARRRVRHPPARAALHAPSSHISAAGSWPQPIVFRVDVGDGAGALFWCRVRGRADAAGGVLLCLALCPALLARRGVRRPRRSTSSRRPRPSHARRAPSSRRCACRRARCRRSSCRGRGRARRRCPSAARGTCRA